MRPMVTCTAGAAFGSSRGAGRRAMRGNAVTSGGLECGRVFGDCSNSRAGLRVGVPVEDTPVNAADSLCSRFSGASLIEGVSVEAGDELSAMCFSVLAETDSPAPADCCSVIISVTDEMRVRSVKISLGSAAMSASRGDAAVVGATADTCAGGVTSGSNNVGNRGRIALAPGRTLSTARVR